MKKSSLIFLVVMAVFIGAYTAYNIHLKQLADVETQLAVMTSEYNTVSADCFVVRDENHKNGKKNLSIVKNSDKGVYIPYVDDGSRVAAGDTIALFFSSEEDARAYREKQLLTETLGYFQKLQNQSSLSTLDIDKLEKTISDNVISLIKICESNSFSDAEEIISVLKYDISAKKIATGEKIDFSVQIKSLEKQIKQISEYAGKYKVIKAPFPGCFISSVDGYEAAAEYENVTSFDKSRTEKLISSKPAKVSASSIGKIIDRYNWYALCNLPKDSLEKIAVGKKVRVSFENTDVTFIEMKVEAVSPVSDGYASVVLSSNLMNSDIAHLRKEKIKIFIDEFEGLRVPREAVRSAESPESDNTADINDKEKLGVYIVYGQLIKFRKIEVLFFGDDFVVAKRDTESSDALKLYDKIITKGRNIYDGKLIG